MGICPCRRDAENRSSEAEKSSIKALQKSAPCTPIATQESLDSSPELTLKCKQTFYRLTKPISSMYKVGREVQSGEKATTFEAVYQSTGQQTHLTILKKHGIDEMHKASLFNRLMRPSHPNILRTYEVCQDDENIYIASEAYQHGTLQEYLGVNTYMPEANAVTCMRQILVALSHCLMFDISHRRLALDKIIFSTEPLQDESIVKIAGFEDVIKAKRAFRTIFRAPEFVDGESDGEKGDVWSCGIILYIMLSGETPCKIVESLGRPKYMGFAFPPESWGRVSRRAVSLVSSMLNKKAEKRPTIAQCLSHQWLSLLRIPSMKSEPTLSTLRLIEESSSANSLRAAIISFILNRVLPESELARVSALFLSLDRDGNGVVTREELLSFFRETMTASEAELETAKVMAKVDTNGSGEIDYNEFLVKAFEAEQMLSLENLKVTFDSLDKDASGAVSAEELRTFFRIDGAPGSIQQWRKLVAEVDLHGDGEITFKSFVRMMKKVIRRKHS